MSEHKTKHTLGAINAAKRIHRERVPRFSTNEHTRLRMTQIIDEETAAPDLLEALEGLVPLLKAQCEADHMLDGFGPRVERPSDIQLTQARAALKKAGSDMK